MAKIRKGKNAAERLAVRQQAWDKAKQEAGKGPWPKRRSEFGSRPGTGKHF